MFNYQMHSCLIEQLLFVEFLRHDGSSRVGDSCVMAPKAAPGLVLDSGAPPHVHVLKDAYVIRAVFIPSGRVWGGGRRVSAIVERFVLGCTEGAFFWNRDLVRKGD